MRTWGFPDKKDLAFKMAEEILIAEGEAFGMQTMVEDGNFNASVCHVFNFTQLQEIEMIEECQAHFASQDLPASLLVIIQIFYALVCISGLCGNTLVIYVVLRFSKMQTVTNIYILMLAMADECFLVGIPFLIVTSVHGDWMFGTTMCKIYMTTTSINQFTSSIFLTVMSADRYIAVCHPISSPKFRTPVIARCVSLTAWAASALLMVPVFMYAATITKPDTGGQSCNIFWPFEDAEVPDAPLNDSSRGQRQVINGQSAFTFYSFVLGFAVPLTLILIFYVLVIIKLKTVGPKNKSKEKKKSHRKVTRLVLTVITVYILCWLPYWITQLALIFTPPGRNQDKVMVAVMLLAGCLSYSNSAMNPVLYAFLSENFKKSFLKACQCAGGREVNAALQVEHSGFPRRRTLAGMRASAKDAKNAAISRFQSTRDQGRQKSRDQKTNGMSRNGEMAGDGRESHEMNDIGASRNARSCFNSSACPTANTSLTVPSGVSGVSGVSGISSIENEEASLLRGGGKCEDHGSSVNGNTSLMVITTAVSSQTTTTVATVNGPHAIWRIWNLIQMTRWRTNWIKKKV